MEVHLRNAVPLRFTVWQRYVLVRVRACGDFVTSAECRVQKHVKRQLVGVLVEAECGMRECAQVHGAESRLSMGQGEVQVNIHTEVLHGIYEGLYST